MEQPQPQTLTDDPARRYTGIVERLYTGTWRLGFIVCLTGERLAFRRIDINGHGGSWLPRQGEAVLFDRLLKKQGPWAVKVRPIDSRRLPTASSEPVAGLRAR